jgi:hypothetical protein
MCEMIDEMEIENLRRMLKRARKELQEPVQKESLVAVT